MSAVEFIQLLGILSSLSSVCNKFELHVKDNVYSFRCIDMFGYVSIEGEVIINNPSLKELFAKLATKIQEKVRQNARR
jgi:hypothetical protein